MGCLTAVGGSRMSENKGNRVPSVMLDGMKGRGFGVKLEGAAVMSK